MCFSFEMSLWLYIRGKQLAKYIDCVLYKLPVICYFLFTLLTCWLLGIFYVLCHIWTKIALFFLSEAMCLSLLPWLQIKYWLRMILRVPPWLVLTLAEIHQFLILYIWATLQILFSKQKKLPPIPYIMSFHPWVDLWDQILFIDFF